MLERGGGFAERVAGASLQYVSISTKVLQGGGGGHTLEGAGGASACLLVADTKIFHDLSYQLPLRVYISPPDVSLRMCR